MRLPFSYYVPSFFKHTSKIKENPSSPNTTMNVETTVNYQRRDPVRKNVFKCITEISSPETKTHIFTASPFLLE